MIANSRTAKSLYNFISGIGGQLLSTIMDFIVRTVFISTLGKTFLGVNGLFSNILSMLSLAELGVGSAIIFKLYDPIAKQDQNRVAVLMKFYKQVYSIIGLVIAVVGACLIPLLPVLIKNYDRYTNLQINLVFVYLLFLFRTVSSYLFFAYKSAIIKANQQEYIINIINYGFTILTAVVRIAALYVFPDFEVYVFISIFFIIIKNCFYARKANQMFPFLKKAPAENISPEEKRNIFKDCGALLLYKINNVVVKGTDNIILSAFLGLETVGLYSNYYLFYKTLNTFVTRVFGSVVHGIGNLHSVSTDNRKEYDVFDRLLLISALLSGTILVGIALVGDELIRVWIGDSWVFDQPVAFLIGMELYTLVFKQFLGRYRSAMGLFRQAKYRPVAGMIINLAVSLIMVRVWGVCGVLFGTVVSDWTTYMWYDPIIIHKYGFKDQSLVKGYFIKYIKYFATSLIVLLIDKWLFSIILPNHGWLSVIVHSLICGITAPAAILATSWNTDERRYLIGMVSKVLNRGKRIVHKHK